MTDPGLWSEDPLPEEKQLAEQDEMSREHREIVRQQRDEAGIPAGKRFGTPDSWRSSAPGVVVLLGLIAFMCGTGISMLGRRGNFWPYLSPVFFAFGGYFAFVLVRQGIALSLAQRRKRRVK
jgi:hypothetical protein